MPCNIRRSLLSLLLLSLGATGIGCGSDESTPPATKPTITTFSASANTVASGATVELTYKVTDATSVSIAANPGGTLLASTATLEGKVTSGAITENTTFVLTATGQDGTTVNRSVMVTLMAANTVSIDSFSADPATINRGQSATLSWRTTNATSVKLDVMNGGNVIPESTTRLNGTETVNPTVTTAYVLTANGPGGPKTMAVMVTVNVPPGPTINGFSANPMAIAAGDETVLMWSVTNATMIRVLDPAQAAVYEGTDLNGMVRVRPTANTLYTLVATNANGMDMRTVMVTVNPPQGARVVSFTASPDTINFGASSVLSWTVTNAPMGIEIRAGTSVVRTSTAQSGMFTVTPTRTVDYTLIAKNAAGNAMAMTTVRVNMVAPMIASFTATPSPAGLGMSTRLSWTVLGASTVRVLRVSPNMAELLNTTTMTGMGTLDVTVTSTRTTFRLEASNASGGANAMVVVPALGPASIDSYTVTPATFGGMAVTATITWRTTGAVSTTLTANGVAAVGFPGTSSGTFSLRLTGTTVLALEAVSPGGNARRELRVGQANPEMEPNNTSSTAVSLMGDGGGVSGTIATSGDLDWYRVVVPAGGSVLAQTSDGMGGCATDTLLGLYTDTGVLLGEDDDDGSGDCSAIDPVRDGFARNLAAGTYYVRVSGAAGDTGSYTLIVLVRAAGCGNGIVESGEQCEDGNTASLDGCSATCRIEPAGVLMGPPSMMSFTTAIARPGEEDYYQLIFTQPGYVRAETFVPTVGSCTGAYSDTLITLFDANLVQIGDDDDDGVDSCSRIDPQGDAFARVAAGTYYLRVSAYNGTATIPAYTLQVRLLGVGCGNGLIESGEACDDGNTMSMDGCSATCGFEGRNEAEPNNTAMTATPLAATATGTLGAASISPAGDVDFYAVNVPAGYHLIAYATVGNFTDCPVDPEARLRLIAPDRTTVLATNTSGGPMGNCGRIAPDTTMAAFAMPAGTYYLAVNETGDDDTIPRYFLHVSVLPPDVCGNGVLDTREQCDDGNLTGADGCDPVCNVEPDSVVTLPGARTVVPGAITPIGDADYVRLVVTQASYLRASTFAPTASSGMCNADTYVSLLASNARTELGVDDDDGIDNCSLIQPARDPVTQLGAAGGDAFARLSTGTYYLKVEEYNNNALIPAYELVVESFRADQCGNGVKEGTEQCDDGNTAAGDGCTGTCTFEPAQTFTGQGGTAMLTFPQTGAFRVVRVDITTAGQSITATASDSLTTCTTDTFMTFADANAALLGSDTSDGPGSCASFGVPRDSFVSNLAVGTYYIVVINQAAAAGSTNVAVSIINPRCANGITETRANETCDDGNMINGDGCSATCQAEQPPLDEVEANDTRQTANATMLTGAMNGEVRRRTIRGHVDLGDEDYFSFTVGMGQLVLVGARTYETIGLPNSCSPDEDTNLTIYNDAGVDIAFNEDRAGTFCSLLTGIGPLGPGTYWVKVAGFDETYEFDYLLDITLTGLQTDPEPNDTTPNAVPTTLNAAGTQTVFGQIAEQDVDLWAFDVPMGSTLRVASRTYGVQGPTTCGGDSILTILDAAGMPVQDGTPPMDLSNDDDTARGLGWRCSRVESTAALPPGRYYAEVIAFDEFDTFDYYLEISLLP